MTGLFKRKNHKRTFSLALETHASDGMRTCPVPLKSSLQAATVAHQQHKHQVMTCSTPHHTNKDTPGRKEHPTQPPNHARKLTKGVPHHQANHTQ
jgi:hypothetical protein